MAIEKEFGSLSTVSSTISTNSKYFMIEDSKSTNMVEFLYHERYCRTLINLSRKFLDKKKFHFFITFMSLRKKRVPAEHPETGINKRTMVSQLASSTTTHPRTQDLKKSTGRPPEAQEFRMARQQQEEDENVVNQPQGQQNTPNPNYEELVAQSQTEN